MYKKIFIPLDNSKYSNYCEDLGVSLATQLGSEIIGGHVYAAMLHNKRFREMESGLPERYQEENELKKQREFHNTLIGKGLRMISDSYLDSLEKKCQDEKIPFMRNIREGKNYLELVKDIKDADYDLVIIGALGLGEVNGNLIGSVCERVVRRINTDVLVVKNNRPLDGRVIVAVDGSEQSFAGVKIAGFLAKTYGMNIEAVSAFDHHYHLVAFAGIANVLSEEMGDVFKSDEQEKLHKEVIDRGLEKIYQDHLEKAARITRNRGIGIKTTILQGKPYDQILKHTERENPALLILGRTGVHSVNGLDMGSATENIIRMAKCNVLITNSPNNVKTNFFHPVKDKISKKTDHAVEKVTRDNSYVSRENGQYSEKKEEFIWAEEAKTRISKVPLFVKKMVVKQIEDYVRTKGVKEITSKIVEEAKTQWEDSMPFSKSTKLNTLQK
ncbi:MAG: universal stress protein UspA [Candidatus Scalindua rubra]|uniref:Universal stress protein UspA n=1 Tax=Candidatus Scalindua rubra TaxID=1872076 RepID=A0A1E3X744_9BACT|nr:MAG: universal stress protein UspA [Candidatus Scalindua rubra]